ncbi:PREDICTED: complement C1r subcomponent-like, partial [Bison bison bison]|uniref:Complement C1r subcomponent-like n=1 Tax=Bison bison bison TaxID=43346 RepID=A0A6P3IVH2_BISBB
DISLRPRMDREENAQRWLLHLLLPVLFYRVGGAIPTPQGFYGEVMSPLFPKPYPNNFERTTVITVPMGYRVKLVFWQFDLEPSQGCFYDYVKDECALQLNSVEEDPPARCQHLCHNYVGGYFCSCRPGYELQPDGRSCQAECSSELFTEPSGYISSLEYPRPYPPDLRCNYSIRVERGHTLHLQFLEPFEIDDHQQIHCPYDQLQIYVSGRNIGEFCGKQRPERIDTQSNSVDLLFFTDESGDSRGWKLCYTSEVITCPQPKTLDSCTIIQDLQPLYHFKDRFTATCKEGYQLME